MDQTTKKQVKRYLKNLFIIVYVFAMSAASGALLKNIHVTINSETRVLILKQEYVGNFGKRYF